MSNQPHTYYVYILSNKNRTTFYIGVTNNIRRRMLEHKSGIHKGFTKNYNVFDLLFVEEFDQIKIAIAKEKQLKNWHRPWKIDLIKSKNPNMLDIANDWFTKEDMENFRKQKAIQ